MWQGRGQTNSQRAAEWAGYRLSPASLFLLMLCCCAQGEFLLTTPRMSVPEAGTIYSVNEGNSQYWDAAMTQCAPPCSSVLQHRSLGFVHTVSCKFTCFWTASQRAFARSPLAFRRCTLCRRGVMEVLSVG